ncbi:MAG: acetyl-CoA carboxylase, carboxyltransferase subunit beta [Lachnospiraceae bacterium]|nr:acetyl-CoA carboxylase, carboxyltransferase subunit beta [Lachnospiraceae bacterium]
MSALIDAVSFPARAKRDQSGLNLKNGESPDFITCKACNRRALRTIWKDNYYVCPECGHYSSIGAIYRMSLIFDPGTFKELNKGMKAKDPMKFPEYEQKVAKQREKTGLEEAAVTAVGRIGGNKVVCVVLDSRFFMGSMSSTVGEKVTRAIEVATRKKLPLIIFSASGGARMQEGIFSLMQMAKTSAAIEEFNKSGGLYISYLTHPTTGGVTASFASLGDITLAEPGALVGFAGPRVIEQTIHKKLPAGFQRSEYLEAHGFVDKIVERKDMRETLIKLIELHKK